MYEARTQGTDYMTGEYDFHGEDMHAPTEDERCYQLMTPCDMLFVSKGDPKREREYLELLLKQFKYDVSRPCRFADGQLSPSFNQCIVERLCKTAIDVKIAFMDDDDEDNLAHRKLNDYSKLFDIVIEFVDDFRLTYDQAKQIVATQQMLAREAAALEEKMKEYGPRDDKK